MEAWLCYDLRTYGAAHTSAEMAAAAIEQVAWADDKGFTAVLLPEHHGAEDGYDSSPFVLAGAMAARTQTLRFVMGAVVLPFHDPLRVAEDAALLDIVSNGRVDLAAGLGYVPSEFAMFGVSLSDRARLTEEAIETLRAAATGNEFEFRGRTVRVTPTPVQDPIPIWVCGAVPASARRAARLGDGFFPTVPAPELIRIYHDECARLGRARGRVIDMSPPLFIHVAEDPEAAWDQVAPHAVYELAEYGRWAAEAAAVSDMASPYSGTPTAEMARASGVYAVVTPEEAIELISASERDGRLVSFKPMMGGLAPDLAWESLELYAEKVLPALRPETASP